MKITIIKKERNEKRYVRVELDEFVSHLREGDYRPITVREPLREVCFAAGWQKSNGGLNEKFANENLTHATIIVWQKNEEIPNQVAEGNADVMNGLVYG